MILSPQSRNRGTASAKATQGSASTGQDARVARAARYDAIVVDVNIPFTG